ncbi:MAG: TetR family transcriptional regulator [Archangium sp.]
MKMAELVIASGIDRSTIHHYRNLGLLPPPERKGPKLHVYGATHLTCLRDITKLRRDGHSLDEIRERLRHHRRTPVATEPTSNDPLRDKVLKAAVPLFLERGYDGVEVAELLRASGVPRVTFYRHFKGKPDCFLRCVDALRFSLATATERAQVGVDFDRELERRVTAVVSRARGWIDLNRLLLQTEANADAELSRRARESLHRMVTNAEPALRRAQRAGRITGGDTELLAYMSWGATLFAAYWLELRAPRAVDEAANTATNFIAQALTTQRPLPNERKRPRVSAR